VVAFQVVAVVRVPDVPAARPPHVQEGSCPPESCREWQVETAVQVVEAARGVTVSRPSR